MNKILILFLISGTLIAAETAQTFTGVITDSMCGRDHKMMKITPDDKCARECVKSNSTVKYALLDGRTVYKLSDQATPAHFAGQKVKVFGTLFPRTGIIQVKGIRAVK